mmetsp:Transcript_7086/g.23266  ORF Transcript_7086/g.23266 Transcript_7086/m.23266 type:complete len:415 (+) Transcript_7086:1016-2260(+)|eukprot:scaffold21568_cov79-Isochrysis_galbana.AAC.2
MLGHLARQLNHHTERPGVEMIAAAVSRKRHARHEEAAAIRAQARDARSALPDEERPAARLQACRQPHSRGGALGRARAVVKHGVARQHEWGAVGLPRLAQPAQVGPDALTLGRRLPLRLVRTQPGLHLGLLRRLGRGCRSGKRRHLVTPPRRHAGLLPDQGRRGGGRGVSHPGYPQYLPGRRRRAPLAFPRLTDHRRPGLLLVGRAQQLHEVPVAQTVSSRGPAHKVEHGRRVKARQPEPAQRTVHVPQRQASRPPIVEPLEGVVQQQAAGADGGARGRRPRPLPEHRPVVRQREEADEGCGVPRLAQPAAAADHQGEKEPAGGGRRRERAQQQPHLARHKVHRRVEKPETAGGRGTLVVGWGRPPPAGVEHAPAGRPQHAPQRQRRVCPVDHLVAALAHVQHRADRLGLREGE